jgi:cellulose synthase/poly-beta-1,6-N-acetylglucosamine synthase-like glycosyltransferase
MSPADAVVLALYHLTLGLLAVYSVHRLYLVRLRRRHPAPVRPLGGDWPAITIQLPLFNEPNVAARLIDAVARIDYAGELAIQVLDDSTDDTCTIVTDRVAHWTASGVRIDHIRRVSRDGYKAGALAHGMRQSTSALYAVFDADFVPQRDILQRLVPHFGDPRVGMVQARWGHLNRDHSLLTRVQAIFLDAHFAVESAARNFGGRFFNFNGTAGIWRREAIEDAGGWSSSTLTEDLDLSYRAQLAGWDFVFVPDVEVPAELPATLSGFQEQQHRWAKGSIQTARKLLGTIVRSRYPARVKAEAFFHLTNNCAYLLSLVLALLIVPAITIRHRLGLHWTLLIDAVLFAASTTSVILFYVEGQRRVGRARPRLRELLAVMPVGIGMSIRNGAAVLEGLVQRGGQFRRTPKRGDAPHALVERPPRIPWAEAILAAFFIAAMAILGAAGLWLSLPFVALFLSGYSYVAFFAFSERLSFVKSDA